MLTGTLTTGVSLIAILLTAFLLTALLLTAEMLTCKDHHENGMLPSRADARQRMRRRTGGFTLVELPVVRQLGFTLVELLVVMGIIALLIGILLPVLSKARAQANRVVCLSNIKQLGTAILMYCNDNKGYFPTCAVWAVGMAYEQSPDDWVYWQANRNIEDSQIAKYVGKGEKLKSILRCPADSFEGRRTHASIAPGQGPYLYSYNMNEALATNTIPYPGARTKITQWRAPSRKIMLIEPRETITDAGWWGYGGRLAWRHGTAISRGNAVLSAGQKMGSNVSTVFLDGHAEGVDDDFACNIFQIQAWAQ